MLDRIAAIISANLGVDRKTITRETDLIKDLSINSIDIVNLVVDMEQEFDIEIPDRQIGKFVVVGDIVDYIDKRTRQDASV
jgi:acyl carrier protein